MAQVTVTAGAGVLSRAVVRLLAERGAGAEQAPAGQVDGAQLSPRTGIRPPPGADISPPSRRVDPGQCDVMPPPVVPTEGHDTMPDRPALLDGPAGDHAAATDQEGTP
jgi:hypothetical protein